MHNCMIKTYPDGSTETTVAPVAIFREKGWEISDDYYIAQLRRTRAWKKRLLSDLCDDGPTEPAEDSADRSKRRAKTMLRDYARSNPFVYFVTLTLDKERVPSRYDIDAVVKIMNRWLDNRCRRNGLQYILVPERHKDGAIHFHGLFNDALPAVDSGTLTKGGKPRNPRSQKMRDRLLSEGWHVVYNLPAWTYGFTTAVNLYGEREAAIRYTTKYITKAQEKIGGRWYYSGGGLALPSVSWADVDDFEKLAAEKSNSRFTVDNLGIDMVRYFKRGEEDAQTD